MCCGFKRNGVGCPCDVVKCLHQLRVEVWCALRGFQVDLPTLVFFASAAFDEPQLDPSLMRVVIEAEAICLTAPDVDRLVKSRRPFPSLDVVFHVSFEHFVPKNARRRTRVSEVDGQDRSGVELCDFAAVEDLVGVSAVGKHIVLGSFLPACAAEFDLREDAGGPHRSRVAYIPRKGIIDEANGP